MNVKIYFAGAILGGRENLTVYQHIVSRLQILGHSVPSEHVARPDVLAEESVISARTVYDRDMNWIRGCDAMIAEVSTPSLGVGYEVASAIAFGKPVLCLHRDGLIISKMISGNPSPHVRVRTYRDLEELDRHIDNFLTNTVA